MEFRSKYILFYAFQLCVLDTQDDVLIIPS